MYTSISLIVYYSDSITGNTSTDPNSKVEVLMKLMMSDSKLPSKLQWAYRLAFKAEIRVYSDLKRGQHIFMYTNCNRSQLFFLIIYALI